MAHKAVFLDRDGTLNEDPGYLSDPAQLRLFEGVGAALARLKHAGFKIVVVTNQSGVGRGLIQPEELKKIHQRMDALLVAHGVQVDHYALCLHTPADQCDCRKPKPKLILDSAAILGIDVSRSYMVGDKESDIEAAFNAGCKGRVLVRTGFGRATEQSPRVPTSFIADTLTEAVAWILNQENAIP